MRSQGLIARECPALKIFFHLDKDGITLTFKSMTCPGGFDKQEIRAWTCRSGTARFNFTEKSILAAHEILDLCIFEFTHE